MCQQGIKTQVPHFCPGSQKVQKQPLPPKPSSHWEWGRVPVNLWPSPRPSLEFLSFLFFMFTLKGYFYKFFTPKIRHIPGHKLPPANLHILVFPQMQNYRTVKSPLSSLTEFNEN